ncbi:MAG: hypothetical protein QOG65_2673 [Actinomycetota bacterium]|nr:hypothetical protein [Actinomycetota bacterium]
MARETGPGLDEARLDEEGVPDLDAPLPEKAATGDPQEGAVPPGERPRGSVDWGVTSDEQAAGEPIGVRVGRELPDLGAADPVDEVAADLGLTAPPPDEVFSTLDDGEELDAHDFGDDEPVGQALVGDDLLDDQEDELVATALPPDPTKAQSAEEAAVHIIDDDEVDVEDDE